MTEVEFTEGQNIKHKINTLKEKIHNNTNVLNFKINNSESYYVSIYQDEVGHNIECEISNKNLIKELLEKDIELIQKEVKELQIKFDNL